MHYELDEVLKNRFLNSFTYHAPFGDQASRYEAIRQSGLAMASLLGSMCPPSREFSLAITALEECVMRANQSIALNEKE